MQTLPCRIHVAIYASVLESMHMHAARHVHEHDHICVYSMPRRIVLYLRHDSHNGYMPGIFRIMVGCRCLIMLARVGLPSRILLRHGRHQDAVHGHVLLPSWVCITHGMPAWIILRCWIVVCRRLRLRA